LIKEARGLPVPAYPAGISNLNELKRSVLVRLEVFYNHYLFDIITKLLLVANAHGLVSFSGSSFHGMDSELIETLPKIALPKSRWSICLPWREGAQSWKDLGAGDEFCLLPYQLHKLMKGE